MRRGDGARGFIGDAHVVQKVPVLWSMLFVVLVFAGDGSSPRAAGGESPVPGGPADRPLPERVDEAISRGADWLAARESAASLHSSRYGVGEVALASLALVKAGSEKHRKCIRKCVNFLEGQCMWRDWGWDTYTGSLLMMLLEALHESSPGARKAGWRLRPFTAVELGKWHLAWMEKLTESMVAAEVSGAWSYGKPDCYGSDEAESDRIDHSNTQFAYLGLRAARRCGVAVPRELFLRGANHFIECQVEVGSLVYGDIDEGAEGEERPVSAEPLGRARGWDYPATSKGESFSMTAAGVSSLIVCRTELDRWSVAEKLLPKIEGSMRDGLACLKNGRGMEGFSVFAGFDIRMYYQLLSLERACDLGGVERLGGWDWYREGCELLLEAQSESGEWDGPEFGPVVNTSMALLFLSRATVAAKPKTEVTMPR